MYTWLIAHNLGICVMILPIAVLSFIVVQIEEKISKKMNKKA